jgi:hypothetical protein
MAVGLACVIFDCPSGLKKMSVEGKVSMLASLNNERALADAWPRLILD